MTGAFLLPEARDDTQGSASASNHGATASTGANAHVASTGSLGLTVYKDSDEKLKGIVCARHRVLLDSDVCRHTLAPEATGSNGPHA
jgi:hypothetical protein